MPTQACPKASVLQTEERAGAHFRQRGSYGSRIRYYLLHRQAPHRLGYDPVGDAGFEPAHDAGCGPAALPLS